MLQRKRYRISCTIEIILNDSLCKRYVYKENIKCLFLILVAVLNVQNALASYFLNSNQLRVS